MYFLSQGLADNTVIAKVNKVVWDLDRPLEEDCTLELLKFEDEEAQAVSVHWGERRVDSGAGTLVQKPTFSVNQAQNAHQLLATFLPVTLA